MATNSELCCTGPLTAHFSCQLQHKLRVSGSSVGSLWSGLLSPRVCIQQQSSALALSDALSSLSSLYTLCMSHQPTQTALMEHVRDEVSDAFFTITPSAHKISTGRSELLSRCSVVSSTTPARVPESHFPGKSSVVSSLALLTQACRADIILSPCRLLFPGAFDRDASGFKLPTYSILSRFATLRVEPENEEDSTADEGAPP